MSRPAVAYVIPVILTTAVSATFLVMQTPSGGAQPLRVAQKAPDPATCTIVGTEGDDRLEGTVLEDVMCGLGGDDTFVASPEDDQIDGGPGADTVTFIDTSSVAVDLNDAFFVATATGSGSGRDELYNIENAVGSRHDDHLMGKADAFNRLVGGPGDDLLEDYDFDGIESPEPGDLRGGRGDDRIVSEGGARVSGGRGNDELFSEGHGDVLLGGAGDDRLDGRTYASLPTAPRQTFSGGAGDDRINPALGDDVVRGGPGTDQLSFECGRPRCAVVMDLARHRSRGAGDDPPDNDDTIVGIERVMGGPDDDVLRGSSSAEVITGGDGDDLIRGRAADDRLNGQAGRDTLIGGKGTDRCAPEPARRRVIGCESP